MATHLRDDIAAQTAADICASIAGALDSDPATKSLAVFWDNLSAKGDFLASERRKLERALGRARARLAVGDARWDSDAAAFGRDVVNESEGRRDRAPYTRFFEKTTPSEVQTFGVDREVHESRDWLKELTRDSNEPLATKWSPRLSATTDALQTAAADRVAALSALAMHGTSELLHVEAINLELDRLEGDLKKLFPGQPKRVASFLSATKPRRKRAAADDETAPDAQPEANDG